MHIPEGVISGGQTGVDRGALDAAARAHIKIGGYVPKYRKSESGRVPDHYPMWETDDLGFATRTRRNIQEAGATLILSWGPMKATGGTRFTLNECLRLGVVHKVVNLKDRTCAEKITTWLNETKPRILNVAGPRESKTPGVQARTTEVLLTVFASASSSSSTTTP